MTQENLSQAQSEPQSQSQEKSQFQEQTQPHKAYSYILMAGHTATDMSQGAVPALLPFLVVMRGIDFTAAAGLMFAMSFFSSLIQPLLGLIADRKQMPWLMGLGILIAGVGVSIVGFIESYWGVFAAIMFSGIGSALFHPEGGRMANCTAGKEKGKGISIFAAGGNIGFVLGPILVVFAITNWGMQGTAILLIHSVIMAAVFFAMQSRFMKISNMERYKTQQKVIGNNLRDDWASFLILCVPLFSRSIVIKCLTTFVPLYLVKILMQTEQAGSLTLTVMASGSAIAAFYGGRIADRFGFRRVIIYTFAALPLLLFLLVQVRNPMLVAAIAVILASLATFNQPPAIVLGQQYLPNRLGLASGITLGVSVSVGGIFSPVLGRIADNFGLQIVFYLTIVIAAIGLLGALLLRKPKQT